MKKNKKIINQFISILMLVIYLFSSLSIISYHNHNEDHHQDSPYCKNIDTNSFKDYDCSLESYIVIFKESCAICDYFANCEAEKLDISVKTSLESFTLKKIQSFTSLSLIDGTNKQNKSPPFII